MLSETLWSQEAPSFEKKSGAFFVRVGVLDTSMCTHCEIRHLSKIVSSHQGNPRSTADNDIALLHNSEK